MKFESLEDAREQIAKARGTWWKEYQKEGPTPITLAKREVYNASLNLAITQFNTWIKDFPTCKQCASAPFIGGPNHEGSIHCSSGSLSSGGTRSHCSCDTCF